MLRFLGRSLAVGFRALQRVRGDRPIHTRGLALAGTMRVVDPAACGWPASAAGAVLPVAARLSRSIGIPAPLPDVVGLAIRIGDGERDVDLAFASTGRGPLGRFVLRRRSSPAAGWLTTLFPYLADDGVPRWARDLREPAYRAVQARSAGSARA